MTGLCRFMCASSSSTSYSCSFLMIPSPCTILSCTLDRSKWSQCVRPAFDLTACSSCSNHSSLLFNFPSERFPAKIIDNNTAFHSHHVKQSNPPFFFLPCVHHSTSSLSVSTPAVFQPFTLPFVSLLLPQFWRLPASAFLLWEKQHTTAPCFCPLKWSCDQGW